MLATQFCHRQTCLALFQYCHDLAFGKPAFLQGSLHIREAPKFYWLTSTQRGSLRVGQRRQPVFRGIVPDIEIYARLSEQTVRESRGRTSMGAALRDLVQHRAPPLRTGGVVAAGASTGLRGRQAGHAPALERTSDTRLATRRRGLAQPRKAEHSRTAKFRACSLKKTDIFFDKHRYFTGLTSGTTTVGTHIKKPAKADTGTISITMVSMCF